MWEILEVNNVLAHFPDGPDNKGDFLKSKHWTRFTLLTSSWNLWNPLKSHKNWIMWLFIIFHSWELHICSHIFFLFPNSFWIVFTLDFVSLFFSLRNKMKEEKRKEKKPLKNRESSLCWQTTSLHGACLGVWLINSLSFHWRKLIFHLSTTIICESFLALGAILC